MFTYVTSLFGVSAGTLDTTALASFFPEVAMGVGLGILLLAFLTAIYDISSTQRQLQQQLPPLVEHEEAWPKAA